MSLSKDTIKALKGLRATHWDQLQYALTAKDKSGEYYGHWGHYLARQTDLHTVVMMALRDLEGGADD